MPVVLDISSDEEQDPKGGLKSDDYDWIREFLGMSESDEEKSDDSDDVVIIHESKPQSKSKSSVVAVKDVDVDVGGGGGGDDDDDDDCVVLDGDPESGGGVTCVDDEETGSDELVVVGEKGQIACRDYPHARHLCAKFPFSSTPHMSHCEQCHCYVCDSLAPCLMWGSGLISSDHCNANDKIDIWKNERKNFKAANVSLLPASTNHGSAFSAGRQCNEVLPPDIIHLTPDSMSRNQASRSTAMHTTFPAFNTMLQNPTSRRTRMFTLSPSLNSGVQDQVPKPTNIPVYSTASNLTIPSGGNHGRCQEPGGSTLARNRSQPFSLPKQWLGVRRHTIHRDRESGASSLGPQFLRSHSMPGRVVASPGHPQMVNLPGHVSSGFSNHVNPALPQFDKYNTAGGFSNDRIRNVPNRVWLPQNPPLCPPYPGSETLAYGEPLPQSNDGHDFYQSGIQGNDPPLSYATSLNGNQHGNQNENDSGNIAQGGIGSQETYQPLDALSIEPLVECSNLPGSGSTSQTPGVNESGTHVTATESIEPLPECYNPLDDFEKWLLQKDRVSDTALLSELNIPSPDDPAPAVGAGILWW